MLINHTKKYVYLRVPKTGSTSFETQLIHDIDENDDIAHAEVPFTNIPNRNWDYSEREPDFKFSVNNPHLTYPEIIQLLTVDISSYDLYGTLRNPIDKFLSSVYHMEYYFSPTISGVATRKIHMPVTLGNNELVEKWLTKINNNSKILVDAPIFKPQIDWLLVDGQPINNIFLYENLTSMMQKMIGNTNTLLRYDFRSDVRLNKSSHDLDAKLKQQILDIYSKDVELYNSIVNKNA
jgi:hypothetical protein